MKILGFNFRPLLSSVDFKEFVSVLPVSQIIYFVLVNYCHMLSDVTLE